MLIRGKIAHWFVKPDHENIWNEEDWGRAAVLESRFLAMGMSERDRRQLIPCVVWSKKFTGLKFSKEIMDRLREFEL